MFIAKPQFFVFLKIEYKSYAVQKTIYIIIQSASISLTLR